MSTTKSSNPILRFPEFKDKWEFKKGKELFINRRTKTENALPIYSVTMDRGLVPRDSLEKRIQQDAATEDNLVACPNDIVYNMMRMWQGALGIAYQNCMISPAYVILQPREGINSEFYALLMKTRRYLYKLESYSYGLTSDRLRLYFKDFSLIVFPVPSINEQTKISNFFKALDSKIEILTKKKTLLEQYKKGIMQQVFSQQIRFKDEEGNDFPEWEEKELGDLLDYEQPTKYLVESTEYSDSYTTPVLTAGKTFILGYTNEEGGVFKRNLPVIIFDDFTTANKYVDFPFKAKSSAMKILHPKKDVVLRFVYEAMQMIDYTIGGHERNWISKYSILKIEFPSYYEQQKIVNFLSGIDNKINAVNKQIEFTKMYKKGLLQQLFV